MDHYKVGDQVIVSTQLHEGDDYNIYCNDEMPKHRGQVATITEYYDTGRHLHRIDLDNGEWLWSFDMFDGLVEEEAIEVDKRELVKSLNSLL